MNFESLKLQFLSYLSDKLTKEGKTDEANDVLKNPTSLVRYFSAFKEYLSKESLGSVDLKTISISDLDKLEYKNGKYTIREEDEDDGFEEYSSSNPTDDNSDATKNLLNGITEGLENAANGLVEGAADADAQPKAVTIDTILSDDNIAAIFTTDTTKGLTEEDKKMAADFLSSFNANEEGLTEESANTLLKLFDADGDGVISAEDSKNAREKLSVLSGTDGELTAEDFNVFGKFASAAMEKNKNMTSDELIDLIKTFDGNNDTLTVEDFRKIKEYEGLGILPESEDAPTVDANNPENNNDENVAPINPTDSGNNDNPSSSSGNSDSGGSSGSGAFSPAIKEKDVSNMSIDELEAEKETAKQAQENAKSKYMDAVKNVDDKLYTQISDLKTKIDGKQKEIDAKQTAIDSLSKPTKEEYTKKNDNDEEEFNENAYNKALDEYEKEKAKLETEKAALEGELEQMNSKMQEYEKEVDKLAEANTELKALKDEYDKSSEYLKTVEATLTKRKADKEKRENGDKLPLTYTLDGKEYHCVGIAGIDTDGDGKDDVEFDSFEKFQRYMAQGGIANIGKYGSMQCFNYSQEYGEVIMGVADSRFTKALVDEAEGRTGDTDTAGQYATQAEYNKRNFAQVKSANRDEEYEVIKNELENGRPCVVSVPHKNGSHYVLAVGMSDDGDILIMDSYNCSMERLGYSRSSDTKSEHRNMATGNGVWIYMEGYSFSYSDKGGIDYAYYRANGTKATLDRILQNRA